MTDIMLAYVEGLPIPNSSSFFTKLASENLGGGCVKCCSSINLSILTSSFFTSGNIFSSSSSSILVNFRKPSNLIVDPEHLKWFKLSSYIIVIIFLSNFAASICDDNALDHINSYNLIWSVLKNFFIVSGVLDISVGLIASWASCAFFAFFPE